MTGPDLTHAGWRKSSHSGSQAAECVEVAATWRKSSHSGSQGSDCVEVTETHNAVAIRDSKDAEGPVLCMDRRAWRSLLNALRDGH